MEKRIYNCPVEVKQILIEIERLHSKVLIERDYSGQIDLQEMAKAQAEHLLLDELRKYIQTDIEDNYGEKCAHSKISLPYIYDNILITKDYEINKRSIENGYLKTDNAIMKQKIEWLELPWYKKLWSNISKH